MDESSKPHAGKAGPAERGGTNKHSYTIPCASVFRDAVEVLALKRRVNVGDIARSVLLVVPAPLIAGFSDPGDPPDNDRESVILKSGPAQGRPWRRKPRLQVRMASGYEVTFIRRALALALAMDKGELTLKLDDPSARPPKPQPPAEADTQRSGGIEAVNEELARLQAIVNVLAFEPLPHGVASRAEALHVLGFPPNAHPEKRMIRARFRMMATIHHPDSNYGSHDRMSQLNQAMELLKE